MLNKVILVEADTRFARQLERYFISKSAKVAESTPADLVQFATKFEPDLIILAAEFASSELCSALHRLPHKPAILLTEHMANYKQAWRAWQMGGHELLMKPVLKAQEVSDAICSAIQNSLLDDNEGDVLPVAQAI